MIDGIVVDSQSVLVALGATETEEKRRQPSERSLVKKPPETWRADV